jgi:major vault protein
MSTKNLEVEVQRQKNQAHLNELSLQQSLKEEETKVHIQDQELRREKAQKDQDLSYQKHQLDLRLAEVKAEVDSMVAKAGAVSPDLIAALQAFSDRALVEKVSASMSPLAILGGKSVADVIQNLLKGTTLENTLSEWSGSNEEKK